MLKTAGAPPQEPQHQPRRERDDPGVDPDAGRSEQAADGGRAHREWTEYGRSRVCCRPGNRMQPLQGARQLDSAGPGEDESEGHRGQGEQHRDETGRDTRVEAEPDHRQNDHADRQPQRELLQRSSHADRAYYGVPRTTPPGSSASRGGRENRADRCRRVSTVLRAMLVSLDICKT